MPPKRGTVVCSGAGRDKGKYMVVMSHMEGFVLLCDGKERPIERPKRKNTRHIFPTSVCLTEEVMKTNKSLRHALSDLTANIKSRGEI